MKTDIVYSVTAHEKPECVWNMYDNIMKFHRGLRVEIIVHANPPLCEELRKTMSPISTMMLHPEPTFKERFTASLFLAHLENFKYVEDIDFDFFCPLASNCMFVHPPRIEIIRNETPFINVGTTKYSMPDPEKWMFTEFMKNKMLNDIFENLDIEICVVTHEGAYLRKEVMQAMVEFCSYQAIDKDIFTNDVLPAEEIIFPSLEKYLTGRVSKRYCGWIPGIKESDVQSVIDTGTCKSLFPHWNNILKIPRDMENPMRKLLTERKPQFQS